MSTVERPRGRGDTARIPRACLLGASASTLRAHGAETIRSVRVLLRCALRLRLRRRAVAEPAAVRRGGLVSSGGSVCCTVRPLPSAQRISASQVERLESRVRAKSAQTVGEQWHVVTFVAAVVVGGCRRLDAVRCWNFRCARF